MASPGRTRIPTPDRTQADPPAPEAPITTASAIEVWAEFVLLFDYTYQKGVKKCPTCETGRPCNNHVCLQCMEGGLCFDMFVNPKKKHYGHPRLQGRSSKKRSSVHRDDLSHFIGLESIKHIHFYQEFNKKAHCLVRRKQDDHLTTTSNSNFKRCASCQIAIIPKSSSSGGGHVVCSLECLIPFARQNPSLQLLKPPSNHVTSNVDNRPVNLPEDGNIGVNLPEDGNIGVNLPEDGNIGVNLPEDGNIGAPAAPTNIDQVDLMARAPRRPLACNICDLVPPTEPVETLCGHLFCWACLYRFLQAQPKPCPTCATLLKWTHEDEDSIDFADTAWVEVDSGGQFNWKPPPAKVLVLSLDEIERRRMLRLATWLNSLMISSERN